MYIFARLGLGSCTCSSILPSDATLARTPHRTALPVFVVVVVAIGIAVTTTTEKEREPHEPIRHGGKACVHRQDTSDHLSHVPRGAWAALPPLRHQVVVGCALMRCELRLACPAARARLETG